MTTLVIMTGVSSLVVGLAEAVLALVLRRTAAHPAAGADLPVGSSPDPGPG